MIFHIQNILIKYIHQRGDKIDDFLLSSTLCFYVQSIFLIFLLKIIYDSYNIFILFRLHEPLLFLFTNPFYIFHRFYLIDFGIDQIKQATFETVYLTIRCLYILIQFFQESEDESKIVNLRLNQFHNLRFGFIQGGSSFTNLLANVAFGMQIRLLFV